MTEKTPFRATGLARPYDAVPTLPVSVLLDQVRSLYNVGAFFRTADAVGVERLYVAGITASPPDPRIGKTALGAEKTVAWERVAEAVTLVEELRRRGHEVAAVETSPAAQDLFDWRPSFPVCVIFGHEVDGVRPEILERADTVVRIPMLGRKGSLNVATAGGVVLYELMRKYRELASRARMPIR
jgi:tRNA G18 (ribose-2'-O)-methylase SpoU